MPPRLSSAVGSGTSVVPSVPHRRLRVRDGHRGITWLSQEPPSVTFRVEPSVWKTWSVSSHRSPLLRADRHGRLAGLDRGGVGNRFLVVKCNVSLSRSPRLMGLITNSVQGVQGERPLAPAKGQQRIISTSIRARGWPSLRRIDSSPAMSHREGQRVLEVIKRDSRNLRPGP